MCVPFPFRVLALAVAAASCGDPPSTGTEARAPAYDPAKDPLVNTETMLQPAPEDRSRIATDEWLFANLDGNPGTLNPILFTSTYETMVNDLVFDSLFTFDKRMEWMPNPTVVEKVEESEDHKTWTVTLKPGLKWHDGTPFTAHDVVYSWKEILDERVPCPAVKTGTSEVEVCEAVDDRTVRMQVKTPAPTSKWDIYFPIIPKHLFEKGKEEDPTLKTSTFYANLNRNPVGNGPYRFVEWKDNDKIVLERWEEYPGVKPYFKRVVFRIIPDTNVALLTFEKQEIDEVRLSAKQFAEETVKSSKFKEVGVKALFQQWSYVYICWNMDGSNPFFNDVRVRRAMTHATNIPLIRESVLYNLYPPCYGIWHPDSPMFNESVQLLPYDLDAAAKLLDEAGWKVSEKDGWRYKDGLKFSFTFTYSQGSSTAPQLAAILQSDLKKLGVEMKIQVFEWAVMSEKVRKHEFQAVTQAWGTGTDPDTAKNIWKTEMYKEGRNYPGYSDPRVDELFEKAAKEFDREKRMAMYSEIQKIVYDAQPYTFIVNYPVLWGFHRRIRGVVFSPRGVWGFDPANKAWWVTPGEQMHGMK